MSFEQDIRIMQLENELRLVRAKLAVTNDRYFYALGALGGAGDCPAEEELLEEETLASAIIETYKKAGKAQVQWANALELEQMGMIEHKEVLDAEQIAEGLWAEYRRLRHS